jgi:hypothetical protein
MRLLASQRVPITISTSFAELLAMLASATKRKEHEERMRRSVPRPVIHRGQIGQDVAIPTMFTGWAAALKSLGMMVQSGRLSRKEDFVYPVTLYYNTVGNLDTSSRAWRDLPSLGLGRAVTDCAWPIVLDEYIAAHATAVQQSNVVVFDSYQVGVLFDSAKRFPGAGHNTRVCLPRCVIRDDVTIAQVLSVVDGTAKWKPLPNLPAIGAPLLGTEPLNLSGPTEFAFRIGNCRENGQMFTDLRNVPLYVGFDVTPEIRTWTTELFRIANQTCMTYFPESYFPGIATPGKHDPTDAEIERAVSERSDADEEFYKLQPGEKSPYRWLRYDTRLREMYPARISRANEFLAHDSVVVGPPLRLTGVLPTGNSRTDARRRLGQFEQALDARRLEIEERHDVFSDVPPRAVSYDELESGDLEAVPVAGKHGVSGSDTSDDGGEPGEYQKKLDRNMAHYSRKARTAYAQTKRNSQLEETAGRRHGILATYYGRTWLFDQGETFVAYCLRLSLQTSPELYAHGYRLLRPELPQMTQLAGVAYHILTALVPQYNGYIGASSRLPSACGNIWQNYRSVLPDLAERSEAVRRAWAVITPEYLPLVTGGSQDRSGYASEVRFIYGSLSVMRRHTPPPLRLPFVVPRGIRGSFIYSRTTEIRGTSSAVYVYYPMAPPVPCDSGDFGRELDRQTSVRYTDSQCPWLVNIECTYFEQIRFNPNDEIMVYRLHADGIPVSETRDRRGAFYMSHTSRSLVPIMPEWIEFTRYYSFVWSFLSPAIAARALDDLAEFTPFAVAHDVEQNALLARLTRFIQAFVDSVPLAERNSVWELPSYRLIDVPEAMRPFPGGVTRSLDVAGMRDIPSVARPPVRVWEQFVAFKDGQYSDSRSQWFIATVSRMQTWAQVVDFVSHNGPDAIFAMENNIPRDGQLNTMVGALDCIEWFPEVARVVLDNFLQKSADWGFVATDGDHNEFSKMSLVRGDDIFQAVKTKLEVYVAAPDDGGGDVTPLPIPLRRYYMLLVRRNFLMTAANQAAMVMARDTHVAAPENIYYRMENAEFDEPALHSPLLDATVASIDALASKYMAVWRMWKLERVSLDKLSITWYRDNIARLVGVEGWEKERESLTRVRNWTQRMKYLESRVFAKEPGIAEEILAGAGEPASSDDDDDDGDGAMD